MTCPLALALEKMAHIVMTAWVWARVGESASVIDQNSSITTHTRKKSRPVTPAGSRDWIVVAEYV